MKNRTNFYCFFLVKRLLIVSIAVIVVGTHLLAMQTGSLLGKLIPVRVQVQSNSIQLIAGGQTIHFNGELVQLHGDQKIEAKWTVAEREFTTFSLNVTTHSPSLLRSICWFAGKWESGVEKVIQSTKLMDNVLFLRKGDMSFFISLDFPYSKIDANGISYPPFDSIMVGQEYSAHSLTIGAC